MDDRDMKHLISRYMESGEPPFPLTAGQLISEGKRRARRRLGLSLGSATAATSLAIVAALTIVPGGGTTVLDRQGCDWDLPDAQWPAVQSSGGLPDVPLSPEKGHTDSDFPSGSTATPPTGPTPPAPSGSIVWPTNDFSMSPGTEITSEPSYHPDATPGPTGPMPSGALPGEVDQSRIDAMACYLKREIVRLLPQASFAPPSAPAMQVIQEPLQKGTSWEAVYYAGAYVHQGLENGLIWVRVQAQPPDLKPFEGEEASTTPDNHTVYVSRSGYGSSIRLATGRSLITVTFDPHVLTAEQGIAFANAPELDLHR